MNVVESLKSVPLRHAWVLGVIAIAFVGWQAPIALQSMLFVSAKVWIGALCGYFIDRSVFDFAKPGVDDTRWQFRRAGVIAAGMLALSLGV